MKRPGPGTRTIAALVGAAALALGAAAPAAADDAAAQAAYLQAVNNDGFLVYNTVAAINTGYHICQRLEQTDGNTVAWELFRNTPWLDTPTLWHAQRWVIDASLTLCPWTFHPGPVSLA